MNKKIYTENKPMDKKTVLVECRNCSPFVCNITSKKSITLARVVKYFEDTEDFIENYDSITILGNISNINIDPPEPYVTRKYYLENCRDNHFKFWRGELFNNGDVLCSWGRIGTTPQSKRFNRVGSAFLTDKVSEKLGKGYRVA